MEQRLTTAQSDEDIRIRNQQLELWRYVRRERIKARNQQIQRELAIINNQDYF
jgi:hypothetical protein